MLGYVSSWIPSILVTHDLFGGEGERKEGNWSGLNLFAAGKHTSHWRGDNGTVESDGDEDGDGIVTGKKEANHVFAVSLAKQLAFFLVLLLITKPELAYNCGDILSTPISATY